MKNNCLQLILVQGVPKSEQFEMIVQRGTELGLSRIIPLLSDHSQVRWQGERAAGKLARWNAIAREAAEQSERGRLPEISPPTNWAGLWPLLAQPARIFAFHARGASPYKDALAELSQGQESSVVLMIGPEGGWSEDEVATLQVRATKLVSLGPRILRTATAALAAIAVTLNALD